MQKYDLCIAESSSSDILFNCGRICGKVYLTPLTKELSHYPNVNSNIYHINVWIVSWQKNASNISCFVTTNEITLVVLADLSQHTKCSLILMLISDIWRGDYSWLCFTHHWLNLHIIISHRFTYLYHFPVITTVVLLFCG